MFRKIIIGICLYSISIASFSQDFIKRQGKDLYYQGNKIYLRGMAFGNLVWDDTQIPSNHHSEIDLERVHDLGMNAIRFYLNYKTIENELQPFHYKQSGWDWIDQNIQWAKAHNIFLILNMHVPQGGFQSRCEGDALWTSVSNQERLAALWKAIAQRYKDEPQIAGYDILNEPTPSGSIQNWSNLAKRIIDSIRSVDNNHLIITERAIALNCDYGYSDVNNNYPQITESNLMYTVHLYDPYEYTHQNLSWANTGDGGKYPDNEKFTVPSDAAYATGDYNNPSIASGSNDWQYFTGSPFTVGHDSILFGRVVFLSNNLQAGKVYFDDIELKELDESGNVIRTVYQVNLTSGTYWWWSSNGSGNFSQATAGHNDNYSIEVTGNTSNATVICSELTFRVVKNRRYVVSGWMKGENIPAGASATISTEYYHSPSKAKLGLRNYEYIKNKILSYSKYIEDAGFPVYFGEFGAARTCFVNNKGGAQWVSDAMHVFDSLGYHFTYHSYKESSFGYYDGWEQPVDPATVNPELTTVFKNFFGIPTFIKDHFNSSNLILLFPNPANTRITIEDPYQLENKITISDMTGKVVLKSTGQSIEVGHLPKGGYLVEIKNSKGVFYKKLIKQ